MKAKKEDAPSGGNKILKLMTPNQNSEGFGSKSSSKIRGKGVIVEMPNRDGYIYDGVDISTEKQEYIRLVCLVQQHPAIWQRDLASYRNRNLVRKEWNEIGEELGMPALEAKRIWQTLRFFYSRVKRMEMSSNGKNREKAKHLIDWPYIKIMRFLDINKSTPQPQPEAKRSRGTKSNVNKTKPRAEIEKIEIVEAETNSNCEALVLRTEQGPVPTENGDPNSNPSDMQIELDPVEMSSINVHGGMSSLPSIASQDMLETADQIFSKQLRLQLESVPDSYEKELFKLDMMKQVVDFKYNLRRSRPK